MISDTSSPEPLESRACPWADRIADLQVIYAISNAQIGIGKYLALMELFKHEDVSTSKEFQKPYKGFYRVRRGEAWCKEYFTLMQKCRTESVEFADILEALRLRTNRCEPSFSSKLLATVKPFRPVWDRFVLKNLELYWSSHGNGDRQQDAVKTYASVIAAYDAFLTTEKAQRWIGLFNERVPGFERISDLKKVDFILWQIRSP